MFELGERIGWTLQNVDEKLTSDFCSKIGVKKRVLKGRRRRRGKIDTDIVDKTMKRYRDEKIPIDKFELFMDIATPTKLDIAEYPNLKSLELSGLSYSRRVNIGRSESLRDLKINNVLFLYPQKIEVDAPNLVSLEYEGDDIPQLKLAKESNKFNNSTLNSRIYTLNDDCDEINMEHLKQHYRVATPKVDVLDVIIESRVDFPTFVDALLWCFHPRRLNISSSFKMIIYFINRLLYMKNSSHSTDSHGNEPQLSQLKEVKAYKFDGKNESWHPVKPESMKLKAGDPNEMEKFYFLLHG
ncbi:hypothetical protein H5410_047954 [Solanum commersonii]|uniref:Uncharacterized protein n=1 Tax=Solanum commersonii TaxID=4109 RepID=A0A9J5XKI0_SOLCO|nr:hypothetical protein H5410_047954 [Solanum commersonii]